MSPRTRQRPAGTGREVEHIAERIARQGYHGRAEPLQPRAPRNHLAVAGELHQAAVALDNLSDAIGTWGVDARSLAAVDGVLTGCHRLLVELRARRAREAS